MVVFAHAATHLARRRQLRRLLPCDQNTLVTSGRNASRGGFGRARRIARRPGEQP